MTFDHAGRVRRLQEAMAEAGFDVALLSVGADLPYFTGYEAMPSERLTVLVVPRNDDPTLFVPELEAPRVGDTVFETRAWGELDDPVSLATEVVRSPTSVAVGDHMWSVFLTRFQRHWNSASWSPLSELTGEIRVRKDAAEVDLLRRAAQAVDRVMARIPAEVEFGGRTERDIARDLAELTVEEGHDEAAFTIVASGPNGASPHHHPSDRVVTDGELIVCDFGGRLGGYFSDSTRTFMVGEPSSEERDAHAAVLTANEAGRAAARPGVACADIDAITRSVIEEAGLGGYFVHRTGHGIGLEVHEHPYIVAGNDRSLEPGMAFSIEPGVYLPGRFGVRIEDIVVCDDEGIESLNRSSRDLVLVQ